MQPGANICANGLDVRGHDSCGVRAAVGIDVLQRFVSAVRVERAVIVVVMRLFFQVQHDVRKAIAVIVHQADARNRERMPYERDHEQKNDRRFAHSGNLTETR